MKRYNSSTIGRYDNKGFIINLILKNINKPFQPHTDVIYDNKEEKYIFVNYKSPNTTIYSDIKYKEEFQAFYEKYPYVVGGRCGKEYWEGMNIMTELNKKGSKNILVPIEYSPCGEYVKLRHICDFIKPFWTSCELANWKNNSLLLCPAIDFSNPKSKAKWLKEHSKPKTVF